MFRNFDKPPATVHDVTNRKIVTHYIRPLGLVIGIFSFVFPSLFWLQELAITRACVSYFCWASFFVSALRFLFPEQLLQDWCCCCCAYRTSRIGSANTQCTKSTCTGNIATWGGGWNSWTRTTLFPSGAPSLNAAHPLSPVQTPPHRGHLRPSPNQVTITWNWKLGSQPADCRNNVLWLFLPHQAVMMYISQSLRCIVDAK
jgi:hypothetical protein